jgi:hypothetical protein
MRRYLELHLELIDQVEKGLEDEPVTTPARAAPPVR